MQNNPHINRILANQNIPLNIAITGEVSSGKSTFINAFRGLNDEDEGAAHTGSVEPNNGVTAHPHPNYPHVIFWDLPGIGSTYNPAAEYVKKVELDKFDFFIIISDTSFRENDVRLAQEIKKMKKKFYFVRSKIDIDLQNEGRRRRNNFDRDSTVARIRDHCIEDLQDAGFESPRVFLVSSFYIQEYDFSLLQETLERELPVHKRNALLMTTPILSLEIIDIKKKAFQAQIKYYAAASAAGAAVPVPGVSVAVDVGIMIAAVKQYKLGFGLDGPTLKKLAARTGLSYDDLVDVSVSPLAATNITNELMLKVLSTLSGTAALMAAEEGTRFIPFFGIPAAMGISFISTYRALNDILNVLADDADRVFRKAFKT